MSIILSAMVSVSLFIGGYFFFSRDDEVHEPKREVVQKVEVESERRKKIVHKAQKLIYGNVPREQAVVRKLNHINHLVSNYEVKAKRGELKGWSRKLKNLKSYGYELEQKIQSKEELSEKVLSKTSELVSTLKGLKLNDEKPLKVIHKVKKSIGLKKRFSKPITSSLFIGGKESLPELPKNIPSKKVSSSQNCSHVELQNPDPTEGTLTDEGVISKRTLEIRNLAQKLQTPEKILRFVRENIDWVPIKGATQTAATTLKVKSGSTVDKVGLLVALLRSASIPTVIVDGEIGIVTSELNNLYGTSSDIATNYAHSNFLGKNLNTDFKSNYYRYLPHTWVRAYFDGQWQSLDPTDLGKSYQNSENSIDRSPTSIDIGQWLFGQDSSGNYVKPYSLVDEILRLTEIDIRTQHGEGMSSSDIIGSFNGRKTDYFSEDSLGRIGDSTPCTRAMSTTVEGLDLAFTARIVVQQNSVNIIDVEVPYATVREKGGFLYHSEGLKTEVGVKSGTLILRVGDNEIATVPGISNSEEVTLFLLNYDVYDDLVSGKKADVTVGGVNLLSTSFEGTSQAEVNEQYERIKLVSEEVGADVKKKPLLMAELLRLAGLQFQHSTYAKVKELRRVRGLAGYLPLSIIFMNGAGQIVDIENNPIGFVPTNNIITAAGNTKLYIKKSSFYGEREVSRTEEELLYKKEYITSASIFESDIWEELFGVKSVSAVKVLQEAKRQIVEEGLNISTVENLNLHYGSANESANASLLDTHLSDELNGSLAKIAEKGAESPSSFWAPSGKLSMKSSITGNVFWTGWGYMVYPRIQDQGNGFSIIGQSAGATFVTFEADFYPGGAGSGSEVEDTPEPEEGEYSEATPDDGTVARNISGSNLCDGGNSSANPVNFATGSMWHDFKDFDFQGRTSATRLLFQRTYLTASKINSGEFADKWTHNWAMRLLNGAKDSSGKLTLGTLQNDGSEDIVWVDQKGNTLLFKRDSNNSNIFESPKGRFIDLVETSNSYEMTFKGGLKYLFHKTSDAKNGKLDFLEEPHGERVTLEYNGAGFLDKVSTGLAGAIILERDGQNKIISIFSERNNQTVKYKYSGNQLVESIDRQGRITKYEYNSEQAGTKAYGLLNTIVDPIGRRIEFDYYNNGKVFKETDFAGAEQTYQYSVWTDRNFTRVHGADGKVTEHRYDDEFRKEEVVFPNGGRILLKWDTENNLLLSRTDELGYKTEFTYDSRGNRTGIKRPGDSGFRTYTYESNFDKMTSEVPRVGTPTYYTIDSSDGDVLQVSRSDGTQNLFLSYTHDSFGKTLSTSSNLGNYSNTRNSDGLLETVFDAGNPAFNRYDSRGRLIEQSYATGRVVSLYYNEFDRLVSTSDSHGPSKFFEYDKMNRKIKERVVIATGETQSFSYSYDTRNRRVSFVNPLGQEVTTGYDRPGIKCSILDQPTKVVDQAGRTTRMEYDSMKRLVRTISPNGRKIRHEYNLRGDKVAVVDMNGKRTTFLYDGKRRLIEKRRPSYIKSGGVSGAYDEVIRYQYDEDDRLLKKIQVIYSGGSEDTEYVTEYSYDALGRRIGRKVLEKQGENTVEVFEDASFEYSPQLDATLMTRALNENADLRFQYMNVPPYSLTNFSVAKGLGATDLNLIEGNFEVIPDMTGDIAAVKKDGKSILKRKYDPAGRLAKVFGKYNGISHDISIKYDLMGRKQKVIHSDGVVGDYTYDLLNRFKSIDWSGDDSISSDITYHNTGNIFSITRESFLLSFNYNNENELVSFNGYNLISLLNPFETVEYSSSGNRHKYSVFGNDYSFYTNNTMTVWNWTNVFTSPDGLGAMKQYSEDINMGTPREVTKSFTWYPDGKLRTSSIYVPSAPGSSSNVLERSAEYFYGPLGRRVAKKKTQFLPVSSESVQSYLHLGDRDQILIGRVKKDGVTKEVLYLDGSGIDEHFAEIGAGAKAYVTDHLGSVLNTEASGGKKVFGPYGENINTIKTGNLGPEANSGDVPVIYGFTGRQLDAESGLYYYRARYYNPKMGRFMTKDPKGLAAGDINIYRYCFNNPVNCTDPTGMDVVFIEGGILGFLGNNGDAAAVTVSGGVALDTDTGAIFTFGTTGTGNVAGGAFIGVGGRAGRFAGTPEQFLGSARLTTVAAGLGPGGPSGSIGITEGSGARGGSAGVVGPGLGIGAAQLNVRTELGSIVRGGLQCFQP